MPQMPSKLRSKIQYAIKYTYKKYGDIGISIITDGITLDLHELVVLFLIV